MNLLNYTKKLYERINFYDKLLKPKNFDMNLSNPFARQLNITIVWVDAENK